MLELWFRQIVAAVIVSHELFLKEVGDDSKNALVFDDFIDKSAQCGLLNEVFALHSSHGTLNLLEKHVLLRTILRILLDVVHSNKVSSNIVPPSSPTLNLKKSCALLGLHLAIC